MTTKLLRLTTYYMQQNLHVTFNMQKSLKLRRRREREREKERERGERERELRDLKVSPKKSW